MVDSARNEYLPDLVSAPGETLLETLEALSMTQAELAQRMGRPKKTISEIIHGKAAITPETALQLERVLGVSASFWNSRERHYREAIARHEEEERLKEDLQWLNRFPVKKMIELGWITKHSEKVSQLRALLEFFGVASPQQWQSLWLERRGVAYRKTQAFESAPEALAAWLRRGEILAQEIRTAAYQRDAFKKSLAKARSLTLEEPEFFRPALVELCAACGVAVVFVPELPKSRASGATRWLSPSKALIQLSFRYRTDDHLWFTFFHEAGHILLHNKRDAFIEGVDDQDGQEEEANRFSADFLIPQRELEFFVTTERRRGGGSPFTKESIRRFSKDLGIAPGIVVGRLQHEGLLPRSHCNDLKRRLEW